MRAIPASLRLANQRMLIEELMQRGTATRADLAKATGMSQPTAGKIIDDLLEGNVLEELAERPQSEPNLRAPVGRPGKQVRLSRNPARFIVIELGAERTRISALPLALPDTDRWDIEFKTPVSQLTWQKKLKDKLATLPVRRPWGVLVSVPGIVDEKTSKVLLSPNLTWAEKTDVVGSVGTCVRAPTSLINESRALALGEIGGDATDSKTGDFLVVEFGDSVSAAMVLSARPYDGAVPVTGQLGHTPVRRNQRRCACGNVGCLETLISEKGLLESFREATRSRGSWEDLVAQTSSRPVPEWLRDTLETTAGCIAAALNLNGLSRVVLAGHVTELGPAVQKYLTQGIERSAMWSRFGKIQVDFARTRRARGLGIAAIQRFVMPRDWTRD